MNKKLAVPPRQNVVQIKDSSKKAFPVHVLSWSSSVGQDNASFDELQQIPYSQITQMACQEHWGLSFSRF